MATCCWERELIDVVNPKSWKVSTDGWVELPMNEDVFFSGIPDLAGAGTLKVWSNYASAMSQYARSTIRLSHSGHVRAFQYGRAFTTLRRGGVHPVIVFVVPDGYMQYYTPLFDRKFRFASAMDLDGDLNVDIPRQAKADPYYVEFIAARNEGFPRWPNDQKPESTSELDIDINFAWVHFDNLEYPGQLYHHHTLLMTQNGYALETEFALNTPAADKPQYNEIIIPIIFVKYSAWLQALSQTSTEEAINTMAKTAGKTPSGQDDSIEEGLNRIYPMSTETPKLIFRINQQEIDWGEDEWLGEEAVGDLQMLFNTLPVQEWSAPNAMEGIDGN